ncbi:MAG: aldo/keto reductase [Chitinophagaceae bacterium]
MARIVLRWLVQRNFVVIPKSVRKDRLKENPSVIDFELTDDEMALIQTLDTRESQFFSHSDPAIIKWFSTLIN